MDIALDARIAFYNGSGISRFARGLLAAIAERPPDFEMTVYQSFRDRRPLISSGNIRTRFLLTPPHSVLEPAVLPFELGRRRHKMIHALDFYLPAGPRLPVIAQVYDLYFLRDPDSLDRRSFRHYSRLKGAASRIAHYICSSEATKNDAVELLGIDPAAATVVYPGYRPIGRPNDAAVEAVRKRFSLPGKILLAVGTIEPRKNLVNLFKGYKLCRDRIGPTTPPLVLAGRKGFRADAILDQITMLGLDRSVIYLGEVTDPELEALYSLAHVVSYVSLYEGFGFPLVEALSAGSTVLAANVSSLPEIGGKAALYVEPGDFDQIGAGLERLITDTGLREELAKASGPVLARYDWNRCAAETIAVYKQAAGGMAQ